MLRSEVNAAQRRAVALLHDLRFAAPPWVTWTPQEWAAQPEVAAYCRARQMGWDVTDFGSDKNNAIYIVSEGVEGETLKEAI